MARPRGRVSGVTADEGISLVEVVIAMFVLAVVALAFGRTVVGSLATLSQSEARQQAYTAATQAIEAVRALSFPTIALATGDAAFTASSFDPDTGTLTSPGTGETVVRVDGGAVTGEPFQVDAPVRLRTIVTRPDDTVPDQIRVTVLAEFERAGRLEVLRQSTLVNEDVEWGLAQPSFSVTPASAGVQIERGSSTCTEHEIVNLGTSDRYKLVVPNAAQAPGLAARYTVTIHEVPTTGPSTVRLSDQWTSRTYDAGDRFRYRICYAAQATATTVTGVEHLIVSEFATSIAEDDLDLEAMSQRVLHDLVVETERTVFLGSRGAEARTSPSVPYLTTPDAPTPTTLANYDTNVDDRPGLLLPRAADSSEAWAARWHHEVGPERDLTGARVTLHYTTPAVVDGTATATTQIRLRLQLRKVPPTGTPTTLANTVVTLDVPATTWQSSAIDLPVTRTAFEAGEQLELVVACDTASTSDCLLGFGATTHPSSLRITFP